jgi:hypothetical protein
MAVLTAVKPLRGTISLERRSILITDSLANGIVLKLLKRTEPMPATGEDEILIAKLGQDMADARAKAMRPQSRWDVDIEVP